MNHAFTWENLRSCCYFICDMASISVFGNAKKDQRMQSSGRGDGAEGAASVEMTECPDCGKWYQAANQAEHQCDKS